MAGGDPPGGAEASVEGVRVRKGQVSLCLEEQNLSRECGVPSALRIFSEFGYS